MARQERKVGVMCPRNCGHRLMSSYNPVSRIDSQKICMDCYIDEIYLIATKEGMDSENRTDW